MRPMENLMNNVLQRRSPSRVLSAGVAFLVTSTLLSGCGEGQAETAPEVSTAEVIRQDLQITAEATGQLEPMRTIEVKSKASGEVREVLVDTGDRVEPGTLLVTIDARDVQNDYNQSQADFDVAQERYNIAGAQLRRSEELLQAGVITAQEHEGRNLEYANARAALVRAETNLELARLRLQDVTIRSPLAGTVLSKTVEEGSVIQSAAGNVSGGTTLLTIANLDIIEVRTLVDQTDVGRIEAGLPAHVRVEALPNRTFSGQVEKIEPQAVVQQNVVMFPVVVHLDNSEGLLKPGMSAEVTMIIAERPQVLTLPNNAIVTVAEVAAAASVLGVPEARAQIDQAAFQELTRELVASRGGEAPARDTAAATDEGLQGLTPQEIRARVQSGDISPEQLREMRQGAGGRVAGGAGAQGFRQARAQTSSENGRPGVVFVRNANGQLSARAVLIGVNDWNNSEVLIGLEEGELVALVGGASLQAQQRERQQQMQNRMGGGLPFGR
jgi:HlyD family secretion protein